MKFCYQHLIKSKITISDKKNYFNTNSCSKYCEPFWSCLKFFKVFSFFEQASIFLSFNVFRLADLNFRLSCLVAFFCQYFLWLCLFYQKTKVQIMFVCSFLLFTLFINFLSSCHHVFSSQSTCCCLNVLAHWLFNSLTFFLVLILHDHFHSSLTSSSFFSFSKFNWQSVKLWLLAL